LAKKNKWELKRNRRYEHDIERNMRNRIRDFSGSHLGGAGSVKKYFKIKENEILETPMVAL
jgi:vacuolar-type H+-ATPase subunit C/Vma6